MSLDLSRYKGNSNASKVNDIQQEKEPVTKVASGRRVSESPLRKLASDFLAEDIYNIKTWFWKEIVIPGFKNGAIAFVEAIFYGPSNYVSRGVGWNGSNTIRRVGGNTPYSSLYSSGTRTRLQSNTIEPNRVGTPDYRNAYNVQDVLIPFTANEPRNITKAKAQEALTTLRMRLNRYNVVSVADFYEAVLNEVPDDIQDHKWGWYDLSGAYIQQAREGYILRMPKNVEPID